MQTIVVREVLRLMNEYNVELIENYLIELIDTMNKSNYEEVYNRLCGAYHVAVIISAEKSCKRFFDVGKEKYVILKRRKENV